MMKKKEINTQFLNAASKGNLPVLKQLYQRGADLTAVNKKGSNALHLAAFCADMQTVTWLLDVAQFPLESKNTQGMTPFLRAKW